MAKPDDAILTGYAWQRGYFASYAPDEPVAIYGSWPTTQTGSEFVAELLGLHERLWVVSYRAMRCWCSSSGMGIRNWHCSCLRMSGQIRGRGTLSWKTAPCWTTFRCR